MNNCGMEPAQKDRTPFSDIDGLSGQMSEIVLDALTEMGRHPEIQRVRRVAFDMLGAVTGQRLLDAGSGNGEVARLLAARVGGRGEVLAVDHSSAVTADAVARHDGSNVRYLTADVAALDLPAGHVDGVWCERVLQHVDDADATIGELLRVTRPGGRICLVDTDWGSLAFDGMPGGLGAVVMAHVNGHFTPRQFDMGRTLRRRLVAAGLRDVVTAPVTCLFTTPASAAVILPMVNPRVPEAAWATPPGLREEWLACVDAAGQSGTFLAVLTIWVAAGTKP
ncbi:Methyltransferase domain-containing protein [Actinoplanes philippinensis]|uniref:Methyltransferase domain-containing protein n=2 Tax=Actinoplanes philippinensis TaxID=35752 RepID=A0A1I2FI60_9ACTN|nr:Methyltransferase domain-containing protein [Actinoplanes philippinensis]